MKILFRVLLLIVALALGLWLWTVLFPSPEKIIRKRLAEAARLASFGPKEGLIARGVNVQRLVSLFASEVEITLDLPRGSRHAIAGQEEIRLAALGARENLRSLRVEVLDPDVTLSSDRQSAAVSAVVKVHIPGEKDFAVQEVKFTLKKVKKDWLIFRVETVRTLALWSKGDSSAARCWPPITPRVQPKRSLPSCVPFQLVLSRLSSLRLFSR